MKRLFLPLFFLLLCPNAEGQPCWPDGIQLFSQFDVDNLQSISQGCSSVEGSVTILTTNITNLDSLSWITSINGNLFIFMNPGLTSLQGLSNLTSVSGSVFIRSNDALADLTGLNNLQTIGGNLIIDENQQLLHLDGLSGLTDIGGDVHIGPNPLLLNVDGLGNLSTIGGLLSIGLDSSLVSLSGLDGLTSIGHDAYFTSLENLQHLDGMNNLKTIGGTLWISGCNKVSGIAGFQTLDSIGGAFICTDNSSLVSFNGPSGPISVADSILISNNALLTDLPQFNHYPDIQSLWITGNPKLKNLDFLSPVVSVAKNLVIGANDSLADLSAFALLKTVGKDLWLEGNANKNLSSFANLNQIGGSLIIRAYGALNSLSGLENLDSIGGTLELNPSPFLKDLKGLDGLLSVGSNLRILGVDSMVNLQGLNRLRFIAGTFEVGGYNASFNSFEGLDSLQWIGKDVIIQGNPQLKSIKSLEHLDSIGGRFTVSFNSSLSDCTLDVLCQRLDISPDSVFIESNAIGCNTVVEVKNQCDLPLGQCLLYGIVFESQAEVDHFAVDYPGCTQITGPVIITGTDIRNLDSLRVLTSLTDELTIHSTALTNLNGLQNLVTIGGSITIQNNDSLKSLLHLSGLDSVGGMFTVVNNQRLNSCAVEILCQLLNVLPDSVYINGNGNGCPDNAAVKSECSLQPGECLVNGITFETQAEVDSFPVNHPGCTTILGTVHVEGPDIQDLNGLNEIVAVGGGFRIVSNPALTSLGGLEQVSKIGGDVWIAQNPALASLNGLSALDSTGGALNVFANDLLPDLAGLDSLKQVAGLFISNNQNFLSLQGVGQLQLVLGDLEIFYNPQLTTMTGLDNVRFIGGSLAIGQNQSLFSLSGLDSLKTIENGLNIQGNPALLGLEGLGNLDRIGAFANFYNNDTLQHFEGLHNLKQVSSLYIIQNKALKTLNGFGKIEHIAQLEINDNGQLVDLKGLDGLVSVGDLVINLNKSLANLSGMERLKTVESSFVVSQCDSIKSLSGLDSLKSVGALAITNNPQLTSLSGMQQLDSIRNALTVAENPQLSDCAIAAVCDYLLRFPDAAVIFNNGTGCNTSDEVQVACGSVPVTVFVLTTQYGPVPNVAVLLKSLNQQVMRQTDQNGTTQFRYLDSGMFALQLPNVQPSQWDISEQFVTLTSSTGGDSIVATLLLSPKSSCPELSATLGLPSVFRGCLVNSEVHISIQNSGVALAEGVKAAVVMPPVFELIATTPLISGQSGDTLFFELGDLKPFEIAIAKLTVKTSCDTFLLDQTLCWETFAGFDNPCPSTLPAFSEIKLSAKCVGDTLVRFTIKNIGDAPTQAPHTYTVFRNTSIAQTGNFSLVNQQSMTVDIPADGATYRMEATKFDNGELTATALENCNGLTAGMINAFWLEKGPQYYDFDCRQVIGSFDPNQKTAVPTGAGVSHHIEPNRPLQYTIDFQNTGTDTAFRVLLRDVLPPNLDVSTFRPIAASHPYTWEIRGQQLLEVLFLPIMLPDSNVNEPASHGFFSFEMDQKPDLPVGAYFENTANIIFDFNPPIVTNTVFHFIGQPMVKVYEPRPNRNLWKVLGSPGIEKVTFSTLEWIGGEKRFELFNASGQLKRSAQFSGQTFDFQRENLPAGLYFFNIRDAQGRQFSGIVVFV